MPRAITLAADCWMSAVRRNTREILALLVLLNETMRVWPRALSMLAHKPTCWRSLALQDKGKKQQRGVRLACDAGCKPRGRGQERSACLCTHQPVGTQWHCRTKEARRSRAKRGQACLCRWMKIVRALPRADQRWLRSGSRRSCLTTPTWLETVRVMH